MSLYFAASLLVAQLAGAPTPPPEQAPDIPADWAAVKPDTEAARKVVREIVAEERAQADSAARTSPDTIRGDKYDTFAARFSEAAVPGCLRPDGLKRQPTGIGPFQIGGLLALPFIAVAKLRGKCN